jgi:hypothetical protein
MAYRAVPHWPQRKNRVPLGRGADSATMCEDLKALDLGGVTGQIHWQLTGDLGR